MIFVCNRFARYLIFKPGLLNDENSENIDITHLQEF